MLKDFHQHSNLSPAAVKAYEGVIILLATVRSNLNDRHQAGYDITKEEAHFTAIMQHIRQTLRENGVR